MALLSKADNLQQNVSSLLCVVNPETWGHTKSYIAIGAHKWTSFHLPTSFANCALLLLVPSLFIVGNMFWEVPLSKSFLQWMDSRPSLILPSIEILNKFVYKVNTKLQLIAGSMIRGLQFTNNRHLQYCLVSSRKKKILGAIFRFVYQQ